MEQLLSPKRVKYDDLQVSIQSQMKIVLVDLSGSMDEGHIETIYDMLNHLAQEADHAQNRLYVIAFASSVSEWICDNYVAACKAFADTDKNVRGRGTMLYSAILSVADVYNAGKMQGGVAEVVVITDGCDTEKKYTLDFVLGEAEKADFKSFHVHFVTIGRHHTRTAASIGEIKRKCVKSIYGVSGEGDSLGRTLCAVRKDVKHQPNQMGMRGYVNCELHNPASSGKSLAAIGLSKLFDSETTHRISGAVLQCLETAALTKKPATKSQTKETQQNILRLILVVVAMDRKILEDCVGYNGAGPREQKPLSCFYEHGWINAVALYHVLKSTTIGSMCHIPDYNSWLSELANKEHGVLLKVQQKHVPNTVYTLRLSTEGLMDELLQHTVYKTIIQEIDKNV